MLLFIYAEKMVLLIPTKLKQVKSCYLGRADESSEMDSRRVVRYPDSHQLFVGNLPHDIDESELKDFFMSTLFCWKKLWQPLHWYLFSDISWLNLHICLLILSPFKHLEMLLSYESTPKALEERFPTLASLSLMIQSRCKEFWESR